MRWKIIAVNAVVVLLVGLLSYALLRVSFGDASSNQARLKDQAEQALTAANATFELDALRTERWLTAMANDKVMRDPFKAGTINARREDATDKANKIKSAAAGAALAKVAPSLVAIVDSSGIVLGRDSSNLMRGEDVGAAHPSLQAALKGGTSASDVWADSKSSELMLVSYAPVRDADGSVLGLIVLGSPLNDERLQRTSDLTSGRPLVLGIPAGQQLDLKAKTGSVPAPLLQSIGEGPTREAALATVQSGRVALLPGDSSEYVLSAAPLGGYGDGRRAVLIAVVPTSSLDVSGLIWPIFGVTALGLILVCIGGFLLGNYIQRPIADLEEGLLAILNGRTDLRFEIEHPELGGVVFRLNSLLNQLMGVQEDDTDDEGRPSRPPETSDFSDALSVDERAVTASDIDPNLAAALRAEPADAYYRRLFKEYIDAKRSVGDPTQQITENVFVNRIRASEAEMRDKHGKQVRYRVEVRGRDVVLLAVPLS